MYITYLNNSNIFAVCSLQTLFFKKKKFYKYILASSESISGAVAKDELIRK